MHSCVCVITTASQCESVIKVQSDRTDLRRRMRDVEQKLQHERQDHRDVNSGTVCYRQGMNRQLLSFLIT